MIEFAKTEAFFEARPKDALLFTYDIYMDVVRLHRYIPSAREPRILRLPNFKLWFPKYYSPLSSGIPSIIRSYGDEVWGIGWRCSSSGLLAFELKLSMPNLYHGVNARLSDRGDDKMPGWTYQITEPDSSESKPSKSYKNVLLNIAKSVGLPDEYIVQLASFETMD